MKILSHLPFNSIFRAFLLAISIATPMECLNAQHATPKNKSDRTLKQTLDIFIAPGSETEADRYYARISKLLGFEFSNDASSLDDLLVYCGYADKSTGTIEGLLTNDLESQPSQDLMPKTEQAFEELAANATRPAGFRNFGKLEDFLDEKVLVSRFFAPKIATYYDPADPDKPIDRDDIVPGWRKLVRIKPKPDSAAVRVGKLKHVYILFNYKRANAADDPFIGNESDNNQVILVPQSPAAGEDTSYFAVFKSRTKFYKIEKFLAADFDLPGTNPEVSKYYVPTSCAACHGHGDSRGAPNGDVFDDAKPNYLDTDQWYDWMDFDFRGVAGSLNDVVFDGGKDVSSARYHGAFEVIRKLNGDMLEETKAAVPANDFTVQANQKWLDLHSSTDTRKPYSSRSIGTQLWDTSNPKEMRLLSLLDNHCFRCHSSMIYNVFDKAAVIGYKDFIELYLNLKVPGKPGFFMPQGRVLEISERDEILRLLNEISPSIQPLTSVLPKSNPKTHEVRIAKFAFVPETIQVFEGDSIVWVNEDAAKHNAQRDSTPFDFRTIPSGRVVSPGAPPQEFFLRQGERSEPIVFGTATDSTGIEYVCKPHSLAMKGHIIVKPKEVTPNSQLTR